MVLNLMWHAHLVKMLDPEVYNNNIIILTKNIILIIIFFHALK